MRDSKPAIKSLGVWGSITGIVGVLGMIPELLELVQSLEPAVKEIINQGTILVGLVMALIGRLTANKVIEGILIKK